MNQRARAYFPARRSFAVSKLVLACAFLNSCPVKAETGEWHIPKADNIQQTSTHFAARWDKNLDIKLTREEMKQGLDQLEKIYTLYTEQIGFPAPYHNEAAKYKVTVNISDKGWATGGGTGRSDPAMWLHFNAFKDSHALAHEFAHSLQYTTVGLRDSPYTGWCWESHAEWMAHQFEPWDLHNGAQLVNAPHLYYGSTRNRYGNWLFWEFLKDQYGYTVVNDIWRKALPVENSAHLAESPLGILMRNQKWTSKDLADRFGEFAMHNVTWDYKNGAVYLKALGAYDNRAVPARFRTTCLDPLPERPHTYAVPSYHAPQQYGYNLVRILPDSPGATLTIQFHGREQLEPAVHSFPVKNRYLPPSVPPPNSDWRWGIVLVDSQGHPSYSALQRGANSSLTVKSAEAREIWLVVAGTPKEYQKILWDQLYYSLYRYPWSVEIAGGKPDGCSPVKAPANRHGAPHPNGGGWVEQTAQVDPSVYIAPQALVLDRAQVRGTARILGRAEVSGQATVEGRAIIKDRALVSGKARVAGSAQITDEATILDGVVEGQAEVGAMTVVNGSKARIADHAVVRTVMNEISEFSVTGNAQFLGDGELHTSLEKGVFYGIVEPRNLEDPSLGAKRTEPAPEVTAPSK